jgi:hypothetical protein
MYRQRWSLFPISPFLDTLFNTIFGRNSPFLSIVARKDPHPLWENLSVCCWSSVSRQVLSTSLGRTWHSSPWRAGHCRYSPVFLYSQVYIRYSCPHILRGSLLAIFVKYSCKTKTTNQMNGSLTADGGMATRHNGVAPESLSLSKNFRSF